MLFLIESIILCTVFTLIFVPSTLKNPLWQLYNYPPAIQERVKSLPEYEGKIPANKRKLSTKITAAVFVVIVLSAIAYLSGARTFLSAFLYTFGLWMTVNWFDTLILDILLFCHYKGFRIKGTEDMVKEYENPWFHLICGIKGSVMGMVVSVVPVIIIWLIS